MPTGWHLPTWDNVEKLTQHFLSNPSDTLLMGSTPAGVYLPFGGFSEDDSGDFSFWGLGPFEELLLFRFDDLTPSISGGYSGAYAAPVRCAKD